jgi:hypothetical protein
VLVEGVGPEVGQLDRRVVDVNAPAGTRVAANGAGLFQKTTISWDGRVY